MNTGIRVLLVDDEERFVINMSRLLAARGFQVEVAGDGLEAVEKYRLSGGMDVVVMDVNMPRLDGMEAMRRIKALDPEAEVIILTGHGSQEDGVRALRLGAFDYLAKPCPIDELADKIRQAREVERIRENPVLWTGNQVRTVLDQDFLRLPPEAGPAQGLALLAQESDREEGPTLFIVDGQGLPLGCLTRRDLLREAWRNNPGREITWEELCRSPEALPRTSLDKIMQQDVMTADPEEGLSRVAHTMMAHGLAVMPVVEEGRMIGQIRLRDILDYMENQTR